MYVRVLEGGHFEGLKFDCQIGRISAARREVVYGLTNKETMPDLPPSTRLAGFWPIPTGSEPLAPLRQHHRCYGEGGRSAAEAKLGIAPTGPTKDFVRLGPNGSRAAARSSPDVLASAVTIKVDVGAPKNPIENIFLCFNEHTGTISKTSAECWANQFTQTGLKAAAWMLLGVVWIVAHTLNEADGMYKLEKSRGEQTFSYKMVPPHESDWPHGRSEISAMLTSLYGAAMATRIIGLTRKTDARRWRVGGGGRKNAPTSDRTSKELAKIIKTPSGKPVMLPGASCPGVSFSEAISAIRSTSGSRYEEFVRFVQREVYRMPFSAAVAAAIFTRVPTFVHLSEEEAETKKARRQLLVNQGDCWLLNPTLANSMQDLAYDYLNPGQQVRSARAAARLQCVADCVCRLAGPTAMDCDIVVYVWIG